MIVTIEGVWHVRGLLGWRVLLNGKGYMLCHEFVDAEREASKLQKCVAR